MSKLEDKLRESRRKERPDLQPPAGGWEAIQASLAVTAVAATAAGTTTTAVGGTAATTAKLSLLATALKALIGLTVLGGVTAAGWSLTTTSDDADLSSAPSTEVRSTDNEVTSTDATAEDDNPGSEQANTLEVAQGQMQEEVPSANSDAPASANKDLEVNGDLPSPTEIRPNSGIFQNVAPANAGDQAQRADSGTETGNNQSAPETNSTENGLTNTGDQSAGTENTESKVTAPSLPFAMGETPSTADDEQAVTDNGQVAAQANAMLVKALEAAPLQEVGFSWSTAPYALEAEILPRAEETFRKHRRSNWTAWQLHGGVNALIGKRNFQFGNSTIFERTAPGQGTDIFVLPSGENIEAEFAQFFVRPETFSNNSLLRLGVTRQTRWGGVIRATLNHYRYNLTTEVDLSVLQPTQIAFSQNERERASFLDLEFQYTFLRRHRFRPFVGIGTMIAVNSNFEVENSFFDAQTGQSGFVSTETFDNPLFTPIDITASLGFQYQVSPRLSVGAQLWGNTGIDVFIEAPIGIEMRYTLK